MPGSNIVYALLMTALLSMTYFPAAAVTATRVNLAASANVDGIAKYGSPVGSGGMDGKGYAYSDTLLGTKARWSGVNFTFETADALDAASGSTVRLPSGNYATLYLLATGVNGNQPNQTFHVTYIDGSTTNFTQSFSDWYTPQNYAGESKALPQAGRATGDGGIEYGTFYLYGYSFRINGAKAVRSVTLPDNRDVVVLALRVSAAASDPPTNASPDVGGIANNGMVAPYGGLDGLGNAYSSSLLGPRPTWPAAGVTFSLGGADTVDAFSSSTLSLPSGKYTTLYLLATGVNGNQPNQTFKVNYRDGTFTTVTQSLSDWYTPQHYAGESKALPQAYRVTGDGGIDRRTFYVYGYSFAINGAKTVESVTLPNNRDVIVLAASLSSGGPTTTPPPPLAISGPPATTAVAGTFYSFTPTVVAPAGSPLTYWVVNKPSWAQFSATTGALSGTPGSGNVAADVGIVVSVSDGAKTASLPAFSIDVTPTVTPPAATATLSWTRPTQNINGTPLTNLAGYVVRYGTDSAALTSQISVGSPNTTELQIGNLLPGNWYFEIAAVNTANVISPYSPMASATIR